VLAVDGDARIAFFLREMEVSPQAGQLLETAFDIRPLGLDLLHANTIGAGLGDPCFDALAVGRTNAIEIEAGQFEHEESPMVADGSQDPLAQEFVQFAVDSGVLRFGEFRTKAGRLSPYFFNAGLFDDGAKLGRLAQFYARRVLASGIEFDMLFGPAYKGIPLAAAVAIELARLGRNIPFAYNRKEAKDHGEGGSLVGAPLRGRVLVVDDVMSAGTAARESIAIIEAAGATPHAVAIALDRQEMATENGADVPHSAVQYVRNQLGLHVCAIARLSDLLQYLARHSGEAIGAHHQQVLAYRERYGVVD
jgi:orotate phosphoribosyltransferase